MSNSNLGKLISNYGTKLWGIISVFIFIPIYIHYLGIENYGVISFNALLLGIISFADAGMSSAIVKEFSKDVSNKFKYGLFKEIEKLYIGICIAVCLVIYLCSGIIANHWLTSKLIASNELAYYISLMGIGITIQLISSLYFGALFGLNDQVKANSYQIIWNIFRSGFVIIIFMVFKPTLEVYFIWQISCNFLYILLLRLTLINKLRSKGEKLENTLSGIPRNVKKYIGGMTLIAIISALNSQADKIITSSFFSLKIFGYYTIASTLAQLPVILGSPLVLFIFPYFSKYASEEEGSNKLNICLDKISYLLNIIIFPGTILLLFYSNEVLSLWTGKTVQNDTLPVVSYVSRVLLIGTLFLALQFPLFYLLLAKGKTKYTIYQGIAQIALGLPLLYICTKQYGLRGVGIPWILINLGSLIYLTWIVFRKYSDINYSRFFVTKILIPAFISLVICLIFFILYLKLGISFYFFMMLSGILSILICNAVNNLINGFHFLNIKELYNFPTN